MRVLVTAASRHGATADIAAAVRDALTERGLDAELMPPDQVLNLGGYDAVVLGSAVYHGHWLPPAVELVARLTRALRTRPVWLFSSGPVGDPRRTLARTGDADPLELPELRVATGAQDHRMFTGRLAGAHLDLAQRAALTMVRGLEGDWRDWTAVRDWAEGIAAALERQRVAAGPSSLDGRTQFSVGVQKGR